ncbi:hypothetical protein LENED_011920 [Lentinula edodes]|uniref:DUF6534 domain-containing protein n=1 Tax=Lentinula edodes TaxID=5353 RepID=A0A1Q3ERA3_LENED|nr:hypothetical protein LENED_011920 [Lentinula edodes]
MASSHISIADGSERRLLRGPFFGMLLSTILLGTVGAQMWFYLHQNQDGRLLRVTVGRGSPVRGCGKDIYYDLRRQRSVSVLASNCLDIATTFNYTVAHFGDTSAMDYLPGYFVAELVLSGVSVFVVDIFFASRIRRHSPWVKSPIFAQNILRACTALISSGAICWGYRSSQAMTRRTESVLQQILQFAVTRGVLLVAAQIVAAIMFEVEPETLRWMIFHMMLDKIYVITMSEPLSSFVPPHFHSHCSDNVELPSEFPRDVGPSGD